MDKKILESIKSILSTNKKIILIPHSSPDADALGSCLALFHFLKNQNIEYICSTIYCRIAHREFTKICNNTANTWLYSYCLL